MFVNNNPQIIPQKMKKLLLLLALFVLPHLGIRAQLQYHEASQFQLIGHPKVASERLYTRLPDSLKGKIREQLWHLGQNSAGMAIRFRSNASTIGARWKNMSVFNMNHMTPTGIRGLDLYCLQDDGTWTFVNSARPREQLTTTATIIDNMTSKPREYMLYLPLYEGIDSLAIGINPGATIEAPQQPLPRTDKPIVWYGTSITQGGCANRPGMAATNIVERKLNREVINLGFSGNGRLDTEVARVMANLDAGLFILDMLPNVTAEELSERFEPFYTILRKAHPTTPILVVETPDFPHKRFDTKICKTVNDKDATLKAIYEKWRKKGDRNLFFVPTAGMIGNDHEGTVDAIHFTDLGFERCANHMLPYIKKHLKQ